MKLIEDDFKEAKEHTKLQTPVLMSNEEMKLVSEIKPASNAGNTYGVVNIGSTPVNDEEDCVSLHKFLDLTHNTDPHIRKKALRELCPCHVKVKYFIDSSYRSIFLF
jgi:oligoendopeptidase F